MALVSMKEMIQTAKVNKYAVGQFNLNSLLWACPILEAAEEERSPVIVASSDRLVDYLGGFETIAVTVKALKQKLGITIPVAIHLDHGQNVDRCRQAIDAGYTSVMIDGSHHPIEENIAMTREVVSYANLHHVSVEAEVGLVGGNEDGMIGGITYADPNECAQLVKEAEIDALAAALGSVHGPYQGEPKLGFDEMKEISEITGIPLVLHGGSGIPAYQIQKAINYGHAKINVNTECAQAWSNALREFLMKDENNQVYEPRVILDSAFKAIKKTVQDKINEFGSVGKA